MSCIVDNYFGENWAQLLTEPIFQPKDARVITDVTHYKIFKTSHMVATNIKTCPD